MKSRYVCLSVCLSVCPIHSNCGHFRPKLITYSESVWPEGAVLAIHFPQKWSVAKIPEKRLRSNKLRFYSIPVSWLTTYSLETELSTDWIASSETITRTVRSIRCSDPPNCHESVTAINEWPQEWLSWMNKSSTRKNGSFTGMNEWFTR
jgi:hypothetical protein